MYPHLGVDRMYSRNNFFLNAIFYRQIDFTDQPRNYFFKANNFLFYYSFLIVIIKFNNLNNNLIKKS